MNLEGIWKKYSKWKAMSGLTDPFFSICHREGKCWCTMVLKYRSMRKIQKKIPGVWTHANQYATICEITQPILSESEVSLLKVYPRVSDIQRQLTTASKLLMTGMQRFIKTHFQLQQSCWWHPNHQITPGSTLLCEAGWKEDTN